MGSQFITRRTGLLNGTPIKTLTKEIAKRAGKPPIEVYSGTNANFIDFLREEVVPFCELDAFASIDVLSLDHRFEYNVDSRVPFAEACRRLGSNRTRMFLRFYGTESATPGPIPSNFDVNLTFGWQTERQVAPLAVREAAPYCAFGIGGASLGFTDLGYRCDLLNRVITAMGLADAVFAEISDGVLTVSARGDWRVVPDQSELGEGCNPRGFYLFGFPNVVAALEAGERVLEQVFRGLQESAFSVAVQGQEDYDQLQSQLNGLATGWHYGLLGALSKPAATVLTGKPVKKGPVPGRVPVFWWSESRQGATWGYSGEVITSPDGSYLELATDSGEAARLEDYVELVEGLIARSA